MRMQAAVIEMGPQGTFQVIEGEAQGPVDTGMQFGLLPIGGADPLTVQVQDGTLVVSRSGERLGLDAIDAGSRLAVDGVASGSLLRSALIVVDGDSALSRVAGTVTANPDGVCGFTVRLDDGSEVSVAWRTDTRVYRVYMDSDGNAQSAEIHVGDLGDGDRVDVYGRDDSSVDGCFKARSVIGLDLAG
jgi:hypothetical protein